MLAETAEKLRLQHDAELERLVEQKVVKSSTDDLASTEAEGRRACELEQATLALRLFTAATDTTATDTAQETHTQTREIRKRRRTRCSQEPPSQAQKSLASAQKHLDGIARRNRLIDEYIDQIQKYRTAKMEVDH